MSKKLSIVAVAAALLVTGSAAFADEYLETTGARSADVQNYRNVYLQDRAPAPQRTVRRAQQIVPFAAPVSRATEEAWFDRAEGNVGQGG